MIGAARSGFLAESAGVVRVGTAGWTIPRTIASAFSGDGSHLERYAAVMTAAEINSSFHRSHATSVYAKWAAMTPRGFRFAVKLPRSITHDAQLKGTGPLLDRFFEEIAGLGAKLGPLLVQLPPSLELSTRRAGTFLRALRKRHPGAVVCEPRHASWFTPLGDRVLADYRVARAATDPTRIPGAERPGGWTGGAPDRTAPLVYYRLHGSPRKYWSRYPMERIERWAAELASARAVERWCIFDNTASGAALHNALELREALGARE